MFANYYLFITVSKTVSNLSLVPAPKFLCFTFLPKRKSHFLSVSFNPVKILNRNCLQFKIAILRNLKRVSPLGTERIKKSVNHSTEASKHIICS